MAYSQLPSAVPNATYSIPGDSIVYAYDLTDNLLTATNREGTITRTYMRNGLLKRKTMDFAGSSLPDDVITYVYDETGAVAPHARGGRDYVQLCGRDRRTDDHGRAVGCPGQPQPYLLVPVGLPGAAPANYLPHQCRECAPPT